MYLLLRISKIAFFSLQCVLLCLPLRSEIEKYLSISLVFVFFMEITVRVTKMLPVQEGTKRDGNKWEKFFFVGETNEQYRKEICFSVFGRELFEKLGVSVGCTYCISFDVESHEHGGRYYTDVRPWKSVLVG